MFKEEPKQEMPNQKEMIKQLNKNKLRNKPCPCGSGKKFKKCCFTTYIPI